MGSNIRQTLFTPDLSLAANLQKIPKDTKASSGCKFAKNSERHKSLSAVQQVIPKLSWSVGYFSFASVFDSI